MVITKKSYKKSLILQKPEQPTIGFQGFLGSLKSPIYIISPLRLWSPSR